MTYNQAHVDAHNDARRHVEVGRTEPKRRQRHTPGALEAYYSACDALIAMRKARRAVQWFANSPARKAAAVTALMYAEGRFAYFSTLCVLRSRKVLANADRPLSLFEAAKLAPRPLRDVELR